ncbi:MAG: VWA domain-containing protein [Pyrinomonadaceae bacterium]
MKKIAVAFCLSLFCLSGISVRAQSRRTPPDNNTNQKANRRPAETAPPAKTGDAAAETDDEIIKIDTRIVTVPVKVVNRSGGFVSGLVREDFQLFEEKAEQEIAFFSDEQEPFTVALVLDMSYSSTFKINEIQSAALAFIGQLREDDRVMVISFDEDVHILSEPTSDRRVLRAAIYKTAVASGTSLYDAVDEVINRRLKNIQGRKAIILFTDGVDTTSRRTFSNNNLRDAQECDALIYPIQYDTFSDVQAMKNRPVIVRQPPVVTSPVPSKDKKPFPVPTSTIGTPNSQGTSEEDYQKADQYLNEMADRTGGKLFRAQTTLYLAQAFSEIAEELRSFYSLGYYPPEDAEPGERRSLKVKVKRDGVSVRARDSYVVGPKK